MRKKIYLDYAAATPVDPRVMKVMKPYFSEKFGNTMSLHSFGQEGREVLEKSREAVAGSIKARPKEIIFTSSATESNNLALKGVAFANQEKGRHIIISPIEHPCVLESANWLAKQGFKITQLPVDKFGLVNPADVEKAVKKDTILVSVIHASNEIGTIEPIEEIGQICRKNKIYGPKGAALLFIKEGVKIEPILHGGAHEFKLRGGTVNLPAVVGFSEAIKIRQKEMNGEIKRLTHLRDKLIENILKKISGSHLNGHPKKRLPNNVNIRFDFIEGESLVLQLDGYGFMTTTGSACSSTDLKPSHILLAIGLRPQEAHGSLRMTLGKWTKEKDIDELLKVLPAAVERLRKLSPFKS